MIRALAYVPLIGFIGFFVIGCGPEPSSEPVPSRSASEVTVWETPQGMSDVVTFCVADRGWIATSDTRTVPPERFFELDGLCSGGGYLPLDGMKEG